MFNRIKCVLIASCVFLLNSISAPVQAENVSGTDNDGDKKKQRVDEYVTPGWVIVKFKEPVNVPASALKTGVSAVDKVSDRFEVQSVQRLIPMIEALPPGKTATLKGLDSIKRIYKMKISEDLDPFRVADVFAALPEIEYAEPMFRYKITRFAALPAWMEVQPVMQPLVAVPNDALFNQQTHIPHIALPDAWDLIKGEDSDVVISIVDGGTDWDHVDLRLNIFTNPDEIPDNGVDDDENGLIDDVNGWNFPQNSNDPTGASLTPTNAIHGTETAGIASAITNNINGIAGASWNARILPINASCADSDLSLYFTYSGIFYSVVMDVDIVNASFGGPNRSNTVQNLVDFARENETLIVASAGNEGRNNDIFPSYPANYNHVLSVGWTGKNFDGINAGSNYGISVDVYAPGSSIDGTRPNTQYGTDSGTSFAAPLAAAVAGLVRARHPDWTIDQVREQVRVSAVNISGINTSIKFRNKLGKGRIHALRAVTLESPAVRILSSSIEDGRGSNRIGPAEAATITVELVNYLEPVTDLSLELVSSSSYVSITDPNISVSALGTGETTVVSFPVVAASTVPFNEVVSFTLNMNSALYKDADVLTAAVNGTIHDTGVVQLTLLEDGNLGYKEFQGDSEGNGFTFLGEDFLFEGGLIMGTGPGKVSDNVRREETSAEVQEDDFERVDGSAFGIDNGRVTTEEGVLVIQDSKAEATNNIQVRLDSYADTTEANNNFVILKYTFENVGTTVANNFHAGLFFDWDSADPGSDFANYDANRTMGIFQNGSDQEANVFIGTRLLGEHASSNFRAIDNTTEIFEDGFTKQEKWDFMTGGVQIQTLAKTDVSTLVSGGSFTIDPGDNVVLAFAVVAGETREELDESADAAQDLWLTSLKSLSANPVSVKDPEVHPTFTFALEDPYPNPVQEETTIEYQLPATGRVALTVYDILGREVRTLANETVRAGKHTLIWDTRDNSGNALASGVYMVSLTSLTNQGLKKTTKKIILVG